MALVLVDQLTGTNNETNPLANGSSTTYGAFAFTAGSSYTLTAVQVPLNKTGSPTFTLNAYVYSNVSSAPGSLVGTGSGSISASTLTTSYANYQFTGLSASLVSGTQYWIVIQCTGSPNDFTNYVQWGGSAAGSNPPYYGASANGTTWSQANTDVQGILATYKTAATQRELALMGAGS